MLELKANKRLYPKYEEYKDSGIDWLEEVPIAWRVLKLKNIGTFSAGGIDKKINEGEIPVSMVNYMDIYGNSTKAIDNKRELMAVTCPEWKILECNLKKGDLLFTPSSETCEDIGLSALILDDLSNTVYSYHVVRLRFSQDIDLNFKKYLCNNHFVLNQFSKASKGTTRQILNRIEFKNIVIVLPSTLEQQKIADFLGKETEKIDKLIDKKQKLIELLKEKRTAIISQAVTKGLDPNVKMKDSGIPWLGEIPEHWQIKPLKRLIDNIINKGKDEVRLFVALEHVESQTGNLLNEFEPEEVLADEYATFTKGDVLFGKLRPYLQKYWKVSFDGCCPTEFFVLRHKDELTLDFSFYIIQSQYFVEHTNATSYGVKMPRTSWQQLGTIYFAYPPKDEQAQICKSLNEKLGILQASIKNIENQIEKIKEYRTALISAAVTGKIKIS